MKHEKEEVKDSSWYLTFDLGAISGSALQVLAGTALPLRACCGLSAAIRGAGFAMLFGKAPKIFRNISSSPLFNTIRRHRSPLR
jgi:hypothetical protein